MKEHLITAAICLLSLASCKTVTAVPASVPAHIEDGVIVLETPEREPGQQSALGMGNNPMVGCSVAVAVAVAQALA